MILIQTINLEIYNIIYKNEKKKVICIYLYFLFFTEVQDIQNQINFVNKLINKIYLLY